MKNLFLILVALFIAMPAFAGDRLLEVQSRLSAALSGILPKTDYLVVVNRIDALDNMGGQVVTGVVRNLPGLKVGVDEEGQVVVKDGQNQLYNGPVSVTVVLDNDVANETYRAIETLLPEIMGGARGGDEIKLKKAVLRQAAEETQPQVVVNNAAPVPEAKPAATTSDLYRVGALFLLGLGAILWFMSRKQGERDSGKNSPQHKSSNDGGRARDKADNDLKSDNWDPKSFESFDPEVVGLYVLKCVRDGDLSRARSFFATASPLAQKAALGGVPGWCASYCLEVIEPKDGEKEFKRVNPEMIMRELTVMEKAMKDDPSAKASALIQWIPTEAMSKVHPESLAAPSDSTRYAIISLRPDLARGFRYDENDALVSGMIFNAKAIVEAGKEMQAWRTRLVVAQNAKTSVVEAMAGIINRTETFIEIDEKLKGIHKKMSKMDWEAMQTKIVSRDTFHMMADVQKKDFLRLVDGADYFFCVATYNVASDWPLDLLLRPKRLAAFRASERMNAHDTWTEQQKREANTRVLEHLRTAYLGDQKGVLHASAA
jgi:hypothetical protein